MDQREKQHQEQMLQEFHSLELSPLGRLFYEMVRNQFRIINRLDVVIEQNEKIMATQADLDAALQGEGTDLASATAALTALEAKLSSITPGQPAPDLSSEIATIGTFRSALQTMAANLGTDASNLGSSGGTDTGSAPQASASAARKAV
jgi:hypothetical protein